MNKKQNEETKSKMKKQKEYFGLTLVISVLVGIINKIEGQTFKNQLKD
jgi:hypothetical protein